MIIRVLKTVLLGLSLMIFSGCQPDVVYSAPITRTIDAEVEKPGVMKFRGASYDGTDNKTNFRGFAYSFIGEPNLDSTILFSEDYKPGEFTALFPYDEIGETLYLRAVSASPIGGATMGETISIVLPDHEAPEVPCMVPDSSIIRTVSGGGGTQTINFVGANTGKTYARYGNYGMRMGSMNSPLEFYLDFSHEIRQGIHTTVYASELDDHYGKERKVYIYILGGFDNIIIDENQEIYISHLPDGRKIIEFCDLKYESNGTDFFLSGRVYF